MYPLPRPAANYDAYVATTSWYGSGKTTCVHSCDCKYYNSKTYRVNLEAEHTRPGHCQGRATSEAAVLFGAAIGGKLGASCDGVLLSSANFRKPVSNHYKA